MSTIMGGNVGIKVNEHTRPYFPTYNGLRQGNALSPLLFDLAANALAILLNNARDIELIKGALLNSLKMVST